MTGALFLKWELKKIQNLPRVSENMFINLQKVYVRIDSWLILKSPKRLPKRWDATSVLKYIYIKIYIKKKKFFRVGDSKWQWHCISTRGMSISGPCGCSFFNFFALFPPPSPPPPPLPQCSSFVVSSVVNTSRGWIGCSFPGPGPHVLTSPYLSLTISLLHMNTHTHTHTYSVKSDGSTAAQEGRQLEGLAVSIQMQHKTHYVHNFQCMFT